MFRCYLIFILSAARTFLAIQNLCVSLCAIGVSFFLWVYACELDATNDTKNEKVIVENDVKEELYIQTDDNLSREENPERLSQSLSFPALETAKFATIVGVISFSSVARLASSGTVIILQKDWIVVISDNDTDYLASM